jgi:hypothetical protein
VIHQESFNGISTMPVSAADDDDGVPARGPVVTKLDYAGSPTNGHMDVAGRLVVATAQYTPEGVYALHALLFEHHYDFRLFLDQARLRFGWMVAYK